MKVVDNHNIEGFIDGVGEQMEPIFMKEVSTRARCPYCKNYFEIRFPEMLITRRAEEYMHKYYRRNLEQLKKENIKLQEILREVRE